MSVCPFYVIINSSIKLTEKTIYVWASNTYWEPSLGGRRANLHYSVHNMVPLSLGLFITYTYNFLACILKKWVSFWYSEGRHLNIEQCREDYYSTKCGSVALSHVQHMIIACLSN